MTSKSRLPLVLWSLLLVPCVPVYYSASHHILTKGAPLSKSMLAVTLGCLFFTLLIVLPLFMKRGRDWIQTNVLKWMFSLSLMVMMFLACEGLLSGLAWCGWFPSTTCWLFEESMRTINFDPIRGYYLQAVPSRFTRIVNGECEYVGTFKGNNYGFPDRDNFSPTRQDALRKRWAILGDSFSAGQYLRLNWPDSGEDFAQSLGTPLELLNFSVDGGGVANWWSILTRLIGEEKFSMDGVVFAVYPGDLQRGFSIGEHRGYRRHMFARVSSWDPETYPKSEEEARKLLKPLSGYIVSEKEFSSALRGEYQAIPELRAKLPFVTRRLVGLYERIFPSDRPRRPDRGKPVELIADIKRYIVQHKIDVVVVAIPSRDGLLAGRDQKEIPAATREFAEAMDATLINGGSAFEGMTPEQIRAAWLPHDGHWGQEGSDRFAQFIVRQLLSRAPQR